MDYIYETYKERSFTVAAKNLYISQPALSAAIQKAEREIGARIFDRSTNPIRLTDAGIAYIAAVEKVKEIERDLHTRLNDISDLKTGKLTVSGASYISSFIIPPILKNFHAKFPGISTELIENPPFPLQEQFLGEETDLMIDYHFDEEIYTSFPVFEEKIFLAVPENSLVHSQLAAFSFTGEDIRNGTHLQKNAALVPLKYFANEPFVLLKKGNDMNTRALSMIKESGINAKIVTQLDQLITSFNFVKAGIGTALVTDTVIKGSDCSGVLFYRPESSFSCRTVRIAYKKNRYISQSMMDAFISTAKEVYEEALFVPQDYEKRQK